MPNRPVILFNPAWAYAAVLQSVNVSTVGVAYGKVYRFSLFCHIPFHGEGRFLAGVVVSHQVT